MTNQPLGNLLRDWRDRRKLSQLDLALASEISARHLSFIETGRSSPSPQVVDRLAQELAMPLRAHNTLRIAAGFAPAHSERPLDDPDLQQAKAIVERVLAAHEPFPAIAIDRSWTLVAGNAALPLLLEGVAPDLLEPPVNVLRIALDPRGLAPRIANFAEWRAHLLAPILPNGARICSRDCRLRSMRAGIRCWLRLTPNCAPCPRATPRPLPELKARP